MKSKESKEVSDLYAASKQLTKKINENILSGRWHPDTDAEREMLREHLRKKKSK